MIQNEAGLSIDERDRRYWAIRQQLKERGVDCAIVSGVNLFYLSNGVSGEKYGLLPTSDMPFTVFVNGRHVIDIPVQVIIDSQDWVKDVRSGNDAQPSQPLVDEIKKLGVASGTVGVLASELSEGFASMLRAGLPEAKIVDVVDVFANARTAKSEEEIALIERANCIFDAAIEAVHREARPGMLGSEVVRHGINAMWEAGGDLDSTFAFNFGPQPKQNPVLADICLHTRVQPGDIATLTGHAEFQHYAGHSDQEISFGPVKSVHKEMFNAILYVRNEILSHVKPGATQRDLVDVYKTACKETKFQGSSHSQIHQYGIDVPEFPGPAFRISEPNFNPADMNIGRVGNFKLVPGMVYSISPTLVAPNEDTLLAGTSIVVTETGYRELGSRNVDFLTVAS